jgi:hypothetical protein
MSLPFDAQAALNYARAIAHPRFTGTTAERTAAHHLAAQLERFGYQVERQPFQFSSAVNVAIISAIAASLILTMLALALSAINPVLSALLATLALAAPLALRAVQPHAERGALTPGSIWSRFGQCYRASNLIARLPDAPTTAHKPHVLLVAHYDSKSQRLPIVVRLLCVIGALAGGALFAVGLWWAVYTATAPAWVTALGALTVLCGLPLMVMDWGDDSPGAIDNASGVGVVLHLAELLARSPEWRNRLRWTILLTAAEELGLMGAAAFVRAHAHAPAIRDAVVINFDGVGIAGTLHYAAGHRTSRLVTVLQSVAQQQGLPLRRFNWPGLLFDHLPFARAGIDAVTLLSVGAGVETVHTPRDTVERLHAEGFAQAGSLAVAVLDVFCERAISFSETASARTARASQ